MGDLVERSQSQKDVLDKIRRSVAAGGVSLGSVALDFRCSATKKGFGVLLKKEQGQAYVVSGITTSDDRSAHGMTAASAAESLDIDISEMDFGSIRCPHCQGGRWTFVKCDCGGLSCSGGVKAIRERYQHTCPWCGTQGYVDTEGTIDRLTGRRTNRNQPPAGRAAPTLLPPTNRILDKGSK